MWRMMLAFFRDVYKYKVQIKKQSKWIKTYAQKKNYDVNPNLMINTNLKVWLSEMEGIYGKRICPCFDPSGDKSLDKAMICPCQFIEEEIDEYGTCHCALFGKKGLTEQDWKASGKRLMAEYRVPLNIKDAVLDTRGMPKDKRRGLLIPDASHQLKNALLQHNGDVLHMIVESEQETINLQQIAQYKGYGYSVQPEGEAFKVSLKVK